MDETLDPAILGELLDAVGGDGAFVDDLVDTFLVEAPTLVASIEAAAAAEDPTALMRPAHTLKSNSLTVGAIALASLARALEERARRFETAGTVEDAAAARVELGRVREALDEARTARWVVTA